MNGSLYLHSAGFSWALLYAQWSICKMNDMHTTSWLQIFSSVAVGNICSEKQRWVRIGTLSYNGEWELVVPPFLSNAGTQHFTFIPRLISGKYGDTMWRESLDLFPRSGMTICLSDCVYQLMDVYMCYHACKSLEFTQRKKICKLRQDMHFLSSVNDYGNSYKV